MRGIRRCTAEELEKESVWRAKISGDAILRAQQICGQVVLARLAKATKLRNVDKWLARDGNVARLIDRLKELGLAVPTETGYDVLLQPGTFAQALFDVGFKNWKET